MNCPYCGFNFKILASSERYMPTVAPIVCEGCGEVGLLVNREVRKLRTGELEQIKQSPSWDFISKAQKMIYNHLSSGKEPS